ncbi:MAG TPA: amino acid ABC transporter substrate-binding protein, partial [Acetobacteraceae bacterium]|nr:amino acid ABC transporter substrate-binding protein [Acetobacteraceae bacterium]
MTKRGFLAALAAVCMASVSVASAQPAPSGPAPTLDAVRARGTLVCGIHQGVAGFALPDSRGVWQGLDVDLCRGLAVAIFNDINRVRFV